MRLHTLAAAFLALMLAACGGNPKTVIATAAGKITIELLDEGVEPHRVLRYDLREGVRESMELELHMTMKSEIEGKSELPENNAPPVGMVMDFDPWTKTKDGNLTSGFELAEIYLLEGGDFDDEQLEEMEEGLAKLEGAAGWLVVTPQGQTIDSGVNLTSHITPEAAEIMQNLGASFKQMPMTFPEQPIGRGARWKVTMPADVFGMSMTQVIIYTLEDIDGHLGKLSVDFTQTAEGQLSGPNVPPNVRIDIVKLESRGSGTMDFNLHHFVPPSIEVVLNLSLEAKMRSEGKTQDMKRDATMQLFVRPGGKGQ
ncbi:MAG: hypothetical protein O7C98_07400 [Planctomycetota bacterium]|nr:hypothetical protein [Planctomycetota bacterium]